MLESWNESAAKSAIVDFVARITREGGADYVRQSERIATFDNDGTLWCEQPVPVQTFFVSDRVRELAARNPKMKDRQPFKAILEYDYKTLHSLGKQGLMELLSATHAGMTEEEFDVLARTWLASAKHPESGLLFKQMAYLPQAELLDYLRKNGFKTFIVSCGGVDFIRAFSAPTYGIPREQVIGSSAKMHFEMKDGHPVLVKVAELNSFDDRDVKPQNIGLHIGRRPILAFGNSDGDLAMMRYAKSGAGARLALLLHHDDAEREFAYDREFSVSPLAEALDKADEYGLTVVSMKRDWKTVFGSVRA